MPAAPRTHERSAVGRDDKARGERAPAIPSVVQVNFASSANQTKPTNGAPPITSTPASNTPGSSAARSARSSTIHASARSPWS